MSLAEAAESLARELDKPGRSGLILSREHDSGRGTDVLATKLTPELTVTIANALDENPELIAVMLKALQIVQAAGVNGGHPAFNAVAFAPSRNTMH